MLPLPVGPGGVALGTGTGAPRDDAQLLRTVIILCAAVNATWEGRGSHLGVMSTLLVDLG